MVLPKLNPLLDKLDKYDAIYTYAYAESVGPWTLGPVLVQLHLHKFNACVSRFWWDQAGGSAKSLGCKDNPFLSVIQHSPKCQQTSFGGPKKPQNQRKQKKQENRVKMRSQRTAILYLQPDGMTNCLCFVGSDRLWYRCC